MKLLADYKTSHFTYCPITGFITNTKTKKVYTSAVTTKGYISVGVHHKITNDHTHIMAHRLAWFLYYGVDPSGVIDHIDRDKINNKITNLQDVSNRANCQNKVNKPGRYLSGADKRDSGNFRACAVAKHGGKKVLGTYRTMEEAHLVSVYYKSLNYDNFKGAYLHDLNGLTHPYETGQLATIVSAIKDTKGVAATNHF